MNDARSGALAGLWARVRRKVAGMAPVVGGALVLALVLWLILWAASPLLPPAYHELVQHLEDRDWAASQESLARLFDGFGVGKETAYVLIQVLQVLFAPIPGQAVGLLGGVLFGFWRGLVLSTAGLAVGSVIAIGIGRLFGAGVVRRLVSQKVLDRFDYLITEGGVWNFFLIYLLPVLPDDAVCFIAGMTRLPVWKLVLACVVGRLPGTAVLMYFSSSIGGNMVAASVVLAAGLLAAIFIWLYSDEVEAGLARLATRANGRGGRAE